MKALAYLLVISVGGFLGYGFWYAQTHAYLDLDIVDEHHKSVLDAQLFFGDKTGQTLAEGKTDREVGIVLLRHPADGYCETTPKDRNARMRECLLEHSVWQAEWLPRLSTVTIRTGSCELAHVPVTLQASAVWAFWWVPLPHVGGLESTRYAGTLKMDRSRCIVDSNLPS